MLWRRSPGVRSLYLDIYFTVVAVLLVFALIAAVLFRRHAAAEETRIESAVLERTRAMAALIERSLPPATAPEETQRQVLLDWSHQLKLPLALDSATGQRIAEAPVYRRIIAERDVPESDIALASRLPDGRVLWTLKIKFKGFKGGPPPGGGATMSMVRAAMASGRRACVIWVARSTAPVRWTASASAVPACSMRPRACCC